jgi:hydrogenase maturation protein HypF
MAPSFLSYKTRSGKNILALGALMKSSFSLSIGENTYISQYLGSTENYNSQQNFTHTLEHFLQLFRVVPDCVATDAHPDYFSHKLALELGEHWHIPVVFTQHHQAHAAAVLAENQLVDHPDRILCIVWDGTGLGENKEIWGGEAFVYQSYAFERIAHLPFFPILAGDKMALEPRLSARSLLHSLGLELASQEQNFIYTEWNVYTKLLNQKSHQINTDSVGRIFDALSSLLNLCQKQSFEGEAAILLEDAATQYLESHNWATENLSTSHPSVWRPDGLKFLVADILQRLKNGGSIGEIAAFFHVQLAASVRLLAEEAKIRHIAFSGGVFQNGLLCDLIRKELQNHAHLYFHRELSSNDENISFGQLVLADIRYKTIH